MMIRVLLVALLALAGAAGCNKPSESDCKKAVEHIRKLHGTEHEDPSIERAAVRSCRGNASKDAVKCILAAQDEAGLQACEGGLYEQMFPEPVKVPEHPATPTPEKK